MGIKMEEATEVREYGSYEAAPSSQPIVKLAQRVSDWTRQFFTLIEDDKNAAGIRDYKDDIF